MSATTGVGAPLHRTPAGPRLRSSPAEGQLPCPRPPELELHCTTPLPQPAGVGGPLACAHLARPPDLRGPHGAVARARLPCPLELRGPHGAARVQHRQRTPGSGTRRPRLGQRMEALDADGRPHPFQQSPIEDFSACPKHASASTNGLTSPRRDRLSRKCIGASSSVMPSVCRKLEVERCNPLCLPLRHPAPQ